MDQKGEIFMWKYFCLSIVIEKKYLQVVSKVATHYKNNIYV